MPLLILDFNAKLFYFLFLFAVIFTETLPFRQTSYTLRGAGCLTISPLCKRKGSMGPRYQQTFGLVWLKPLLSWHDMFFWVLICRGHERGEPNKFLYLLGLCPGSDGRCALSMAGLWQETVISHYPPLG